MSCEETRDAAIAAANAACDAEETAALAETPPNAQRFIQASLTHLIAVNQARIDYINCKNKALGYVMWPKNQPKTSVGAVCLDVEQE